MVLNGLFMYFGEFNSSLHRILLIYAALTKWSCELFYELLRMLYTYNDYLAFKLIHVM